jgi:polar amino acid transport system permease protein
MGEGLDFGVVWANLTYFMIGRFPHGPLGGLALTLYLASVSCLLSFLGGLALGLLSVSGSRPLRWLTTAVVNVVRGVPLLMVVFWAYFMLPAMLGQPVAEAYTVIFALSLFTSAYMCGIVRAGIQGVPAGQREAALASGLKPWQVMAYVVLPQGLRNMVPSLVNQFVSLIKDTSLAFIVGVSELTHVATQVNNRTMVYSTEIFIFIALVYFVVCWLFTALSRRLERRLARGGNSLA